MRLIIFDLDHTLLIANSSFRFGCFLYRQNFFSFWTLLKCLNDYARHRWLGMSVESLHTQTFIRLFKGRSFVDVNHQVDCFLSKHFITMLYHPVVKRLKEAQDQGDKVMILSSSPDFLVKAIACRLNVLHWKSTVYESDAEGNFCAISHIMDGREKARYVKALIDEIYLAPSAITVYSDSHLDLPILKMAGEAIGVRPDRHLKRVCLQNGWEIL